MLNRRVSQPEIPSGFRKQEVEIFDSAGTKNGYLSCANFFITLISKNEVAR